MPVYRGAKKAKRHSTLIRESVEVVALAQRLEEVKRILPGIIKPRCSRGEMSIKIIDEPACLKLVVHGSSAVQELRLYTNAHAVVRRELEKVFRTQ